MKWSVTEQGPRVLIEICCENNGEGLYKAYIQGNGGRVLLGTLMPEKGQLYLKRLLSIDSLRRQGCWPIRRVERELVCSFQNDLIQWEDEVLRNCAKRMPYHTLNRNKEGFSLSFPFDPHKPFPLTPAFCFARVENGKVIFSFHSNGIPYIFAQNGKYRGEGIEERRGDYGKSDYQGTGCIGGSAGI